MGMEIFRSSLVALCPNYGLALMKKDLRYQTKVLRQETCVQFEKEQQYSLRSGNLSLCII